MTKSSKKKPTVDKKSNRMEQLSAEEREQLSRLLMEDEFRKAIEKGIESADSGQLKPASEVLNRLKKRATSR